MVNSIGFTVHSRRFAGLSDFAILDIPFDDVFQIKTYIAIFIEL